MAAVLVYLNPSSISDLERGVKRALGPVCRLLDHLDRTGSLAVGTAPPGEWAPSEIRAFRLRRGFSQDTLADAVGYAFGESVSALERGVSRPMGAVRRLLDLLHTGDLLPE